MPDIGKNTESALADAAYLVVTADLVDSRHQPDRAGLQAQLLAALASINTGLRRSLCADVQLTAGDEVQALLRAPAGAMELLQRLADAVHPAQFAFGLGFGSLSTPLPARRSARRLPLLDGQCFHRARAALQAAQQQAAWAQAEGFRSLQVPLNALLELIGNIRHGWTEKQGLYAAAARDAAQKDVADRFGVNPSVISESLKGARLELLRRGEEGVRALLQHFAEQPHPAAATAAGAAAPAPPMRPQPRASRR